MTALRIKNVTPYRRRHLFSYLGITLAAAMILLLFSISGSNMFALGQVKEVDRKKPLPRPVNSHSNKATNGKSDSEGVERGREHMARSVDVAGSGNVEPVVINYTMPQSKKRRIERIKHDTGDDILFSRLRRVYSASAHPETGLVILVVRFSTENTCGDSSYVYSFQSPPDIFKKVLMVECVQQLIPTRGVNSGYPALIYVDDHSPDYRYMATLKFNGERYEEEACKTATRSNSMTFVPVKCQGRGLISW
jgi:hypothetical protein